jgi:hypothetical protein
MGNRLTSQEKKLRKLEKMNDPLGIDKMSDEEFLENLGNLKFKAYAYGGLGIGLMVASLLLLVLLWGNIF